MNYKNIIKNKLKLRNEINVGIFKNITTIDWTQKFSDVRKENIGKVISSILQNVICFIKIQWTRENSNTSFWKVKTVVRRPTEGII